MGGGGKSRLRTRPGGSVGAWIVALGALGGFFKSVLMVDDILLHSSLTLSRCCSSESSFARS